MVFGRTGTTDYQRRSQTARLCWVSDDPMDPEEVLHVQTNFLYNLEVLRFVELQETTLIGFSSSSKPKSCAGRDLQMTSRRDEPS